jgi:hypothetical protein
LHATKVLTLFVSALIYLPVAQQPIKNTVVRALANNWRRLLRLSGVSELPQRGA